MPSAKGHSLENSYTTFKSEEEGIAISRAIKTYAFEILQAADEGDPPLSVIEPFLKGALIERIYYKYCDWMIGEFLGSEYLQIGRNKIRRGNPEFRGMIHIRTCYARITVHQ